MSREIVIRPSEEEERLLSYELAPEEVKFMAARLISSYHGHLANAKIIYLMRNSSWKKNGRETWGQAHRCSEKEQLLLKADFIITLNGQIWPILTDTQKRALLDHELLHCCGDGSAEYPFYLDSHTFEGFAQEVSRHGFWRRDLQQMRDVTESYRPISLFTAKEGDS